MAKKTRRQQRPTPPPPTSTISSQPTTAPVTPTVSEQARPATSRVRATAPAQAPTPKGPPDWAKDYGYVMDDLKRVGVLAGVIFVALIVLSVVIR
jgi:hypothetical protein